MPCESLTVLSRNGCNGKNRSSRKKLLRRRSSGGADLLVPTIGETDHRESELADENDQLSQAPSSTSWFRFKRENTRNRSDLDTILSRRRGSLPVEMQGVSHSGKDYSLAYCEHYCLTELFCRFFASLIAPSQ